RRGGGARLQLPAHADARGADARARVREDERPLAGARGSLRADGRGGRDGEGAARRHRLHPRRDRGARPGADRAAAGTPPRLPGRLPPRPAGSAFRMSVHEPEKKVALDAEYLSGRRFPYQEDLALLDDVDLVAATPGEDINWLEDVELLQEDGVPAVFDRYSNAFLKIYFPIPAGRENELARKVLVKHLQSGDSYGI